MAKNRKRQKKIKSPAPPPPPVVKEEEEEEEEEAPMLKEVDDDLIEDNGTSSEEEDEDDEEDDDNDDDNDGMESGPESIRDILEGEEDDEDDGEFAEEAAALRAAIAEGAFDGVVAEGRGVLRQSGAGEDESEEDEDDDEEEEEEHTYTRAAIPSVNNVAALRAATAAVDRGLPWPETFDVTASADLGLEEAPAGGGLAPVHDDLTREVAFYEAALGAVNEARQRCGTHKIPFDRPVDFYAEMVKGDSHMAKVKDRLIFESKKIEAFEQRKNSKEQKLRSKEAQSDRAKEKAKTKKDNIRAVGDYAKDVASRRMPGFVEDEDDNGGVGGGKKGPNWKRERADKKFGFGGKRGKFKQNTKKDLEDMSKYNPRGNFGGMGKKTTKGSGGAGGKRPG
eukprot:CAMPEP_0194310980 /NCGR_PEP_ID=MMETSP0171-20130528/7958_1 /TAXON_ID=218684 /ORGANISM="Corethron pennatum, Strain L29A3" /LENGTH=393 /DNA_ID=CAMNT_0039064873 /DNA_START=24 /DNA_END=1202 /DNA_ORIENTATION=-